MAGTRALGAAGRRWVSLYAGSAGRHSCVCVGTRCSPPAVRGGPCCEGRPRPGALPPPAALLLGAVGGGCPRAVGGGVRVRVQRCPPGPYSLCSSGAGSRGFAARVSVVRGVCGQAIPLPRLSALWAGCRGPSSTLAEGAGVRVWGPGAVPSACMPCGGRAPRGWLGSSPGGWPATVARGVCGRELPLPRLPAHWAGCWGPSPTCSGRGRVGFGGPSLPPWSACPVGAACRGGGGGPSPGGVACHCCEGRLVSGAVLPPTARPLGRAAGVPRPVCSGCGRCGRGNPASVPQRAPLRAGVACCGGGGRASPGGVPSTVVRGV